MVQDFLVLSAKASGTADSPGKLLSHPVEPRPIPLGPSGPPNARFNGSMFSQTRSGHQTSVIPSDIKYLQDTGDCALKENRMSHNPDRQWKMDLKRPWKVPPYNYQEDGFDGQELFWDVQEFVIENFAWLWALNLFIAFFLSQVLRPFLPGVHPAVTMWVSMMTLFIVTAAIYGTVPPTKGKRLDYRRKKEEAGREL
jgi:hypothetical protein